MWRPPLSSAQACRATRSAALACADSVYAVAGRTVYAGGLFSSIGGQHRESLAALDARTGKATASDPNHDDMSPFIDTLAVRGSTVCVGGDFDSIGGQRRHDLAAVDTTPVRPRPGIHTPITRRRQPRHSLGRHRVWHPARAPQAGRAVGDRLPPRQPAPPCSSGLSARGQRSAARSRDRVRQHHRHRAGSPQDQSPATDPLAGTRPAPTRPRLRQHSQTRGCSGDGVEVWSVRLLLLDQRGVVLALVTAYGFQGPPSHCVIPHAAAARETAGAAGLNLGLAGKYKP